MKKLPFVFCFFSLLLCPFAIHASYIFKNGKLIKSEEVATLSVQEHYSAMVDAHQKQNWEESIRQALIIIKNFSSTPFANEAYFHLGVGYFYTEEYEFSNRFLTSYLKKQATPKYFEEAIQYKFKIAEGYHRGAKKHILGWETLPKWVPAREEAIAIYDEVITALPHHELAAHALFGKAKLQLLEEEYKSSIETYQTLIRRFPKHPLAAESYIGIGQVYLAQSQQEYPDQDYLDLAEINLRKFRHDFPREEKLAVAERLFLDLKEVFASDLYDTARFYERTAKAQAAHLYYTRLIAKYPETKVAGLAAKRLSKLPPAPAPTPAKVKEPAKEAAPLSPLNQLPVQGMTVDNPSSAKPDAGLK